MVVDDTPQNLKILEEFLCRQSYHVVVFPGGAMALKAAVKHRPDLVLLDIMMPDMDGYEVCRRFKADERLKDIPIIFLSALSDTVDKTKAFSFGCVDYITKPFEFEEVDARVKTQMLLAKMRDELASANKRLEATVEERTQQLRAANGKLMVLDKAKTDFLNLIAHEMRTPLTGIIGVAEYLTEKDGNEEIRQIFRHSHTRVMTIVNEAQHFVEMSVLDRPAAAERVSVLAALREATLSVDDALNSIGAELLLCGDDFSITVDATWFRSGLEYVLKTAVRLAEPRAAIAVTAAASHENECAIDVVIPHAPIGPNVCLSFFDIFGAGSVTHDPHFGLAPALAQRFVSLLGGTLSLVSGDGQVVFSVRIPR